jgi:hypothetical protein
LSYDRTNTGTLGKNERKQQDSHPDITGSINIDGVEFFLDGWRKERTDGTGSFYSLKAKKKDKQPNAAPAREDRQSGSYAAQSGGGGNVRGNSLDEDLPFAPEFR